MKKLFKWIFGALFVLLVLAVGALAALVALEVRVQLDPLRGPVEVAAERALGRDVRFDGDLVLVPTLWPTLAVSQVTIANPPEWPRAGVFATAGVVRLQLGVTQLLSGEIRIADVTARDVAVNLASDTNGEPNWRFKAPDAAAPDAGPSVSPAADGDAATVRFSALHNLTLEDIDVNYVDHQIGRTLHFGLTRLQGAIPEGRAMELRMAGSLQGKRFRFELEAGSLEQLAQREESWPLTLSGELSDTRLTAEGMLVRGAEPEISATLQLDGLDIGEFLSWLDIVEGVEASADAVTVSTVIRGDSMAELIARSEIAFGLRGGAWAVVHRGTGERLNLGIDKGRISVLPDAPVTLALDAGIDGHPVSVNVTGPTLPVLLTPDATLPLEVAASGGGADLRLASEIARPFDGRRHLFRMQLDGSRLDAMNDLLDADLPPIGPYSIGGTLRVKEQGYAVEGLRMRVGDTVLGGDLDLDIASKPPRLDADLRSRRFQIDDFRTDGWSATEGAEQVDAAAAGTRRAAAAPAGEVPPLMSREALTSLDADVSVAVDEVLYGTEAFGRGSLRLVLDRGRLSLDPLEVELPGGAAKGRFLFHPGQADTEIGLFADVDQFDYGVLARRIDPQSQVAGRLSLDLDIKARADSPEQLLLKGEGHLGFGIWPEQLEADVFELWAVGVISALVTQVDPNRVSKVNCVIARFGLGDGVMNDRVIFADTTRMRIEGSASVDFRQRTLQVRARPKAKRPEFFSLAVPVGLNGSFDNFGITINPVDLTGTTVSFVTSPLHVPLRRIFATGEPADGDEACARVWTIDEDPAAQEQGAGIDVLNLDN